MSTLVPFDAQLDTHPAAIWRLLRRPHECLGTPRDNLRRIAVGELHRVSSKSVPTLASSARKGHSGLEFGREWVQTAFCVCPPTGCSRVA